MVTKSSELLFRCADTRLRCSGGLQQARDSDREVAPIEILASLDQAGKAAGLLALLMLLRAYFPPRLSLAKAWHRAERHDDKEKLEK